MVDRRFKWHPWEQLEPVFNAWMLARIDRSAGPKACWPWTDIHPGAYSYGSVYDPIKRRTVPACHVVWRLWGLDLPDGFNLIHGCANASCVNPAHLKAVTPSERARYRYRSRS